MTDSTHPEWLADGATVAVKQSRSYTRATVKRHTATQVIIEVRGMERRFRADRRGVYGEIGGGDTWQGADTLLPLDDPDVVRGFVLQAVDREFGRLVADVEQLYRTYRQNEKSALDLTAPDLDEVRAAVDRLAAATVTRDAKLAELHAAAKKDS